MRVTNVVLQAEWQIQLNLKVLSSQLRGARYNPKKFSGLIWKDKEIGGCCLVFNNGKIICNGAPSEREGYDMLKKYTSQLMFWQGPISLNNVRLVTISACHKLSGPVDLRLIYTLLGGSYEPEIFNGAMLKRDGVHYTIFATGNIVITGLKEIGDNVYATLLELELCVKS